MALEQIWKWIGDNSAQLTVIGGLIAAIAATLWKLYNHRLTQRRVLDREAPSKARRLWLRRSWIRLLLGISLPIALMILAANWLFSAHRDPRLACIPLQNAGEVELASHWSTALDATTPPPPPRIDAQAREFVISDLGHPDSIQSVFTTSRYSFAERTTGRGPGGGKVDVRLRVGGWGDTYLSLLKVPVPTDHPVQRAVIRLTVLGDQNVSRPTTMTLRAVDDDWQVSPSSNNRLWWRDCPQSHAVRNHLPAPGSRGSRYEIDITNLYNLWAVGQQSRNGIMLEPEHVGSWRRGRPQFSNFSTFYSTRATDPANRPRLVLTY